MTLTGPNRLHWEAVARGERADWAGLATGADGIEEELVEEELVEDPAGSGCGRWARWADRWS